MNFVINGLGVSNDENVTGIQRVFREVVLRLDGLLGGEPDLHAEYLAKKGAKNEQFEELSDITLEHRGESFDTLKAKSAKRIGDEIFFDNGVSDVREGYEMYSEVAHYDLKTRILQGKRNFYIKSKSEDIKGENVRYDAQNGVLKADKISAKLKLKPAKNGRRL